MKWAYLCEPELGGAFTYYEKLSPILAEKNIEMRCISPISREFFSGTRFEDYPGVDFLSFPSNIRGQLGVLIEYLQKNHFDVLMVLPVRRPLDMNIVHIVPRHIRTIMHVPMMTRSVYRLAKSSSPSMNKYIAVSSRIGIDLQRYCKIPRSRISTIFHGVDTSKLVPAKRSGDSERVFRLLYCGRLVDADKGVMWLPDIMKSVVKRNPNVLLDIVGNGMDSGRLKSRFEQYGLSKHVLFHGGIASDETQRFYQRADCLVLPSRFEGCGFSLLEAMAFGCVPVASKIRGSIDEIIVDGKSGFCVKIGRTDQFAQHIVELSRCPARTQQMKQLARERVVAQFSLEKMSQNYVQMLNQLFSEEDVREPIRSVSESYDVLEIRKNLLNYFPQSLKNRIRMWAERFGISA